MTEIATHHLLLSARSLTCIRGGKLVFSNIDIDVAPRESVLIRGPNGAGKSSLLRLLAGLLPCRHGTLQRHTSIALADEQLALDGHNRLEDALTFWARIDGSPPEQLIGSCREFGLQTLMDVPVRMLSTGQRKRAILARTMASNARLWLLDEPGNGLDSRSMEMLAEAMRHHIASGGAILAASHFDLAHSFDRVLDITSPSTLSEGAAL